MAHSCTACPAPLEDTIAHHEFYRIFASLLTPKTEIEKQLFRFASKPLNAHLEQDPYIEQAISYFLKLINAELPIGALHVPFRREVEATFINFCLALLELHVRQGQTKCQLMKERAQTSLLVLETTQNRGLKQRYQDQFFHYIAPTTKQVLHNALQFNRKRIHQTEQYVCSRTEKLLQRYGVQATVHTRQKTLYSSYHKTRRKQLAAEDLLDLVGVRIITQSLLECYLVLDVIRKKWAKQIILVQDYIAIPKPNGYQSIHINAIIKKVPIEFQIRDRSMHLMAEHGQSTSHQQYKSISVQH